MIAVTQGKFYHNTKPRDFRIPPAVAHRFNSRESTF